MSTTDELYSFVYIEPESLANNIEAIFDQRSRYNAFLRALSQFGIVLCGSELSSVNDWIERFHAAVEKKLDNKNTKAPHIQDLYRIQDQIDEDIIRLSISQDNNNTHSILSIPTWEDSPLGFPWRAAVAREGRGVLKLIEPAFQVHDHVVVLDPALGSPNSKAKEARDILLQICQENKIHRLEVFTETGLKHDLSNKDLDHQTWSSDLSQEIKKQYGTIRLKHSWYAKPHDGTFHDRFIGFTKRGVRNDVFQAIFIGCGLLSCVENNKNHRLTTVARIPGEAFKTALDSLYKLRRRRKRKNSFKEIFSNISGKPNI